MNAPLRRGCCPDLKRPMQTGDGLLARLHLNDPDISPAQLISILQSAKRHGNGLVEMTRRGNLQIRGLTSSSSDALERESGQLGLDQDGPPITMSGLAGIDPREVADPRPVATAIRSVVDSILKQRLAPKMSIIVDGRGQISVDRISADIRLTALEENTPVRWKVSVGGTAATARLFAHAGDAELPGIVVKLLKRIAELGPGARGRDLDPVGVNGNPAHGRGKVTDGEDSRLSTPLGPYPSKDRTLAVGIGLAFGCGHADDLISLVSSAGTLGATRLRLAAGRAIVFRGLSPSAANELIAAAPKLGFISRPGDSRSRFSVCAGAPFCGSAHLETRKFAAEIARDCGPLLDGSFAVHVSGCDKRCADTRGPQLSITGNAAGCNLIDELGSTSRHLAMCSGGRLTDIFKRAAADFHRKRHGHTTAKSFFTGHFAAPMEEAD